MGVGAAPARRRRANASKRAQRTERQEAQAAHLVQEEVAQTAGGAQVASEGGAAVPLPSAKRKRKKRKA